MKKLIILIALLLSLSVCAIACDGNINTNGGVTDTNTDELPCESKSEEIASETNIANKEESTTNTEAQTNTESETYTETCTQIYYETTSQTEAQTETDTKTGSESESNTPTETVTETKSETEPQTESENVEISENHAPDFTVLDANGKEVKLSDYFGKPIVINFWASWCPPCQAEMPHFEEAYRNNPDVQFIMLNCTYYDTVEAANKFISDSGYTFPVFYDTSLDAMTANNVTALPTTYFIAANGEVVSYGVGGLTADELNEGIQLIK